jgi:hypothetical protein
MVLKRLLLAQGLAVFILYSTHQKCTLERGTTSHAAQSGQACVTAGVQLHVAWPGAGAAAHHSLATAGDGPPVGCSEPRHGALQCAAAPR